MLVFGDVHGRTDRYWKMLQKYKPGRSICVGDFGFRREHDWHLQNVDSSRHKILFGNHDYYPYLDKPHSLGDWHSEILADGRRLMAIRGAWSIDRAYRTEGVDWFADEEIALSVWDDVIAAYTNFCPDIVVSHDCPQDVKERMFGFNNSTRTGQGLQTCFFIHPPALWIFGHYHENRREKIGRTLFKCVGELECFEIA